MANHNPRSGRAVVVGGGITGLQAALHLADSGFAVSLVEQHAFLGGRMAALHTVFPTGECAA